MEDAKDVKKEKSMWVVCPNCKRKLAKQVSAGRYEAKMKKRKDVYFCAEVVIGALICPGCNFRQTIPTVAIECDEPREHKQWTKDTKA